MNWHQWWVLQKLNLEAGAVILLCVSSFGYVLWYVFAKYTHISQEEFNARLRKRMSDEGKKKDKGKV